MTDQIPLAGSNLEVITADVFAGRLDEILDMITEEGVSLIIEHRGHRCLLAPCSDLQLSSKTLKQEI